MRTAQGDAPIDIPPEEQIRSLAVLYDRFANALDPDSPARDEAERAFVREISAWYDNSLKPPRPTFHEFRRAVIIRCRKHLLASDKPASV
jgi:hypothetical protein